MQTNSVAAAVIAEAFLYYPTMTHAFEGKTVQERSLLLPKLFTRCVAAADKYGGVVTTRDNSGALIWLAGDYFPMGFINEFKAGMAAVPFEVGVKATLRLMNHEGASEQWIKDNSTGKMGYIWCVGVLPNQRGQGHSRTLIDASIEQMKQQGITDYWLKTEDPKNVLIYTKLGFEVVRQIVVKSSRLTTWFLRKKLMA